MARFLSLFYAVLKASLVFSALCNTQLVFANTISDTAKIALEATAEQRRPDTYPVLLPKTALRYKPASVEIYQVDRTPLGKREPLVLVHGLRAEYRRQLRWRDLIAWLNSDPKFKQLYKIYLIRYDSTAELSKTTPLFANAILNLHKSTGEAPITVLAMSLGGVLAHVAMQDPQVDSAIRLLFAMATPFHGSPLFCKDWFQYSLYKNLGYPITRIDHSLSYRMYFACNRNLLSDINWDNCDNRIPDIGPFHSHLPFGPRGVLTVAADANTRLAQLNQSSRVDKAKIIAYSGYLVNPYLKPSLRSHVEWTILAPYTFLTLKLPEHLGREHPVLKVLNREISRMIPAQTLSGISGRYPYGLNDGISPVSSAIFLSPEVCKLIPLSQESNIARVKSRVDVSVARVFRGADHLTFIDGYRPHHNHALLRDELNPDQPARSIFNWILCDLLRSSDQISTTIAKEAKLQSDH